MNKKQLLESYATFLEKSGYSPAAARVYALLLVWDNNELHFDEITGFLQLSKGAVSGALKFLENAGRVEIISRIGVRKRFYRAKVSTGVEGLQKFLEYIRETVRFMDTILASRPAKTTDFNAQIQLNIDFMNFLCTELADVQKKWHEVQPKNKRRSL